MIMSKQVLILCLQFILICIGHDEQLLVQSENKHAQASKGRDWDNV